MSEINNSKRLHPFSLQTIAMSTCAVLYTLGDQIMFYTSGIALSVLGVLIHIGHGFFIKEASIKKDQK